MLLTLPLPTQVHLQQRQLLTLSPGDAQRLTCLQGSVWLTRDDDPQDVVLEAGQAYCADDARRLIVCALSAAVLRLEPVQAGASAYSARSARTPSWRMKFSGSKPSAA